jgi:CHAD domain-containing protein
MRVASRRLRETMRVLAPLYPPKEFDRWYRRVRGVTRALGPVRDSDVFVDDFSRMAKGLGNGGKRAVAFFVGYRLAQRDREVAVLNRRLGQLDLAESQRSFRKMSADVSNTSEAKRPLTEFAYAAVAQRSGVVFGALPVALDEANVLEQHVLRIDFKRLRYAVEVFATCYGTEFDALHAALTAFQNTLGDLHDIHVFLDMVREPQRAVAARRGGVSESDLLDVTERLEERAHDRFAAFCRLADEHPANELLSALLLPLTRTAVVAPEPVEGAASQTVQGEAPVVEPVTPVGEAQLGGASETAEAATPASDEVQPDSVAETAPTPEPAVVLEPAAPVPAAPPIVDPAAQPWRSDAAGLSIDPPIVIGAEPWARTPPAQTEDDR